MTELGTVIGAEVNVEEPFFLANEAGVYDSDVHNKSLSEWFSWGQVRVVAAPSDRIFPLSDNRVLRAAKSDSDLPFSIIRPQTAEEITAAAERAGQELPSGVGNITIGIIGYHDWRGATTRAAFNFSKANLDIEIIIKNYHFDDSGGYATEEGWNDAYMELNADILSGNCPDVLLIGSGADFFNYARQGLFQDLQPYFDSDMSFNPVDYFENILYAFEQDGKQYGIPVCFSIDALVGKEADLLDIDEWNLDEFIAFADRYPDSSLFYHRDLYRQEQTSIKTKVMEILLYANGENIVDWNSQSTGFQRDFFIKMLEFANRFDDAATKESRYVMDRINDGDIQLMPHELIFIEEIQIIFKLFSGPVRYIGYPSEYGSGFMISGAPLAAISSKCENTQTAWDLIRYLLSEEVQSASLNRLPLRRDSLEKWFDAGRGLGQTGTVHGSSNFWKGDSWIYPQEPTDEERQIFRDVINSAEKARVRDKQVDMIIMEEVGAYFSGQKTVEEVTDIIASRVGIYVNEMK
jgi:ABC-type glycerol-3-phosphate transport system substrate-binding protein